MENISCRLCLKTCKRVKTLNELKDGVPYWLMIKSISDIKLSEVDLYEKACISCCRRLVEAYNFKLLIESSNISLQNSNHTKRIIFNNIEDVKIEIHIRNDGAIQEDKLLDNIKTEEAQFNYHDTLIKRVCETDRKPVSVVEFLNYIKEQSDDEGYAVDMNNDDNYEPDDEPYYPDEEPHNPDDETHNPDDSEEEDDILLIPLNKRKTRNKIYDEIKTRVTTSIKKLRNDDDFDEDYVPGRYLNKTKKEPSKNTVIKKRPIGRPSDSQVLPLPVQPQVLENVRIQFVKENKIKTTKKLICYHCGKMCPKSYLKAHMETHSPVAPKFKCDKCPKAYRAMKALQSHQKVHEPRSIKCEHCVATFVFKHAYLSHLRHHTDEKNFVCELCSKAFKLKYQLKRHRLHSHNIGLKEYKCDLCEKVCKSRDLLKHHYRVHTGERPYNCEICSQPYSYKHDFNRHCLKKHGVLFKRRSVKVMNEEVLVKERALMRDLMLRMNGVHKDNLPENPFEGPQGHFAYQQMMKFLETKQLPVDFQL